MSKKIANQFPFLDQLDIDSDVRRRLSDHLRRMVEGNSDVYVTPYAKRKSPDAILAEWDKVFQANLRKMDDPDHILIEIEISQKEKFSPRSIAKPWSERRESVDAHFGKEDIDCSSIPIQIGPQGMEHPPEKRRFLRPISLESSSKLMKPNTNSGLPYYTRKGKVLQRTLDRFDEILDKYKICIAFTRTQEQGKTRLVWGYPLAITLYEMRYYRPLLDYQKRQTWRAALLGPEEVSKAMTRIVNRAVKSKLTLVSIDFSAYDASIGTELICKAFAYIKELYQTRYHDDLDYICRVNSTIGLLTPDGIRTGPHGEPSGSTFTNEVDSIVQWLVANISEVIESGLYQIQGDDGVYAVKHDKVTSLYNAFKKFGLNVNEDKSYLGSDFCVYLQNLYHIHYEKDGLIGGIYPTYRALNRIIYQERWSDFEDFGINGRDYYAIRTITILENCKYHPLFQDLVKFVVSLGKYSPLPSSDGIQKYIEMIEASSGTEGILINQYGDDIRGIRSFESYKLIKGMC